MFLFKEITDWLKPTTTQSRVEKTNNAFKGAILIGVFALIFLCMYAIGIASIKDRWWPSVFSIFSVITLIAFASFAVGGISGFLFGIPRTLQNSNGNSQIEGANNSNYSNNTNLEQISDWLTKIMVGVGLTQIHKIIVKFNELSFSLSNSLIDYIAISKFAPVAGAIMIMFFIDGFLIVYLWTRLFLAKIQDNSLDEKLNAIDTNDKLATSIANRQINLPMGINDLNLDDLYNAFKKASGTAVSNIFFKAVNIRKLNWNAVTGSAEKNRMERTIPIFKTLIKLDNDLEFPENFAELGYVLKDKTNPDYKGAFENLSISIDGFKKSGNTQGIGIVYFNRAFCRIKLDENFNKQVKELSIEDNFQIITSDLKNASKEDYVKKIVDETNEIKEWKIINATHKDL